MGMDSPVSMDWSSKTEPSSRRTSAATTAPRDSFTISPGTNPTAGAIFQTPSRLTDVFSARRAFSAAKVACARDSWKNPSAALNTRRPAMTDASTYLLSTTSSAIAASSIHGTGVQNLLNAESNGCTEVSGIALRPNFISRIAASSLVRPVSEPSEAMPADSSGEPTSADDATPDLDSADKGGTEVGSDMCSGLTKSLIPPIWV